MFPNCQSNLSKKDICVSMKICICMMEYARHNYILQYTYMYSIKFSSEHIDKCNVNYEKKVHV